MARLRAVKGGVEVSTDSGVVLGTVRPTGDGPLSSDAALAALGYIIDPESGAMRHVGPEAAARILAEQAS